MGWKRSLRKLGKLKLHTLTGGLSYALEKQMDAQKELNEATEAEQRRANAEMERLNFEQAGKPISEMTQYGADLNISGISGKGIGKTILSRIRKQQEQGNKMGAGRI